MKIAMLLRSAPARRSRSCPLSSNRIGHCFEDKGHERELRAGALLKSLAIFIAELRDPRHVDLVNRRHVCGRTARSNHVVRNLLAHDAHLFDAIAFEWFQDGSLLSSGCAA